MNIIFSSLKQRQCWRKVHLYLALLASAPLLLIAITGIVLAFDMYIRALVNPQTVANPLQLPVLPMENIVATAQNQFPELTLHMIVAPKSSWHAYLIYASKQVGKKRPFYRLYINPYDANITAIQNKPTLPLTFIKRIHRNLLLDQTGRYIVATSSIILMLLSLVGIYLWWPMRRRTISRAIKKKQRISIHNLVGIAALPMLLMLAFTGITVTFKSVVMPFVFIITQSAPLPAKPTSLDKVKTPVLASQVLTQARAEYPNMKVTSLGLPKPNTAKPYSVRLRHKNDVHPMGWLTVFYDVNTGEKLAHHNTAEQSIAAQYNQLWYPLHTGEVLGFIGAILWSIVCILLIYLIYSGILLWNKRRTKIA
ncbi:PepSY-associated TM helix domain-containing protein [Thalassotalea sp. 1_MG-2023]|uniref:PepSY-associated TM helix domain-containing protein n=1 Tax=Thalassotalea sp. 1_MG-2023 TaxID=3062680 RepID=UPI0026E2FFC5|nr:PepSY-associated TM helix domain-containing protein [Thalassotalea sp. 1_MG-2023]MDO6428610.1 PepSY-associated TM helix domain-containing protein [Thalassotalea sp. 1_MG-2023]